MGSVDRTKLKVVASFGQPRRRDRVRVVEGTVKGESVYRVQWKEGSDRKTQSFPLTRKGLAEAKAYGAAKSDRLATRVQEVTFEYITVRQLFDKYLTAKVSEWRPRTYEVKRQRWQMFELFVGAKTPAHMINRERMDEFKKVMMPKHSPNQVAHLITNAISVFRWGVDRDLLRPTKLTSYRIRFGKDVRKAVVMAEYSPAERSKIMAVLDLHAANTWRAAVLTTLFSYCGPRENAALRLEWRDVDLDHGTIRWRSENDKMGTERVQPMPEPVLEAMKIALEWRNRIGYQGCWVFPGARPQTKGSDRHHSPVQRCDQMRTKLKTPQR